MRLALRRAPSPWRCVLGWARVRSSVTALAFLFALAVALDLQVPAADECCAVEACRGQDHQAGASDECPPGCDDGCACCARVTGLPVPTISALSAIVVHTIEYVDEAQLAPPAPEPRGRDAVPRRAPVAT